MTATQPARQRALLDRIEAGAASMLAHIGRSSLASLLALLALCALAYGPGFLRLPPVDRTEVVFAESSREMLEAGRLVDPRYMGEPERHRPIGTFWAQMASARAASLAAGPGALATMQPYRLPSLMSVVGAVLLVGLLLRPLVGGRAAFVSAALFAVTPIAALQSQLAIAESVTLAPAVAAQLALLRLYAGDDGAPRRGLALLLWSALGIGIVLDALLVPILSLVTLIALAVMDRDRGWLARLGAWWGVPLMVLLGAPWIVALVLAEHGMPFADLPAMDVLKALGGSQAMKFKAWPLTFTVGLLVGLMFTAPLVEPAMGRLWGERRHDRVARFLLAWLLGYLIYLEAISSKPALYSVQVMLPAATTAVALLLSRDGPAAPLRWAGAFPAWPGYLFAAAVPALYVTAARLADAPLGLHPVLWALPAVVLLALAAHAAGGRRPATWLAASVLGAALFLATTFGKLMPALEKGWTTEVIARASRPLAACAGGPISVIGYREPSAVFTFRPQNVHLAADEWQPGRGVVVVDERQVAAFVARARGAGATVARAACLEGINVTRGCTSSFTAFVVGASPAGDSCAAAAPPACAVAPRAGRKPCS